jgi:hypothetical protein
MRKIEFPEDGRRLPSIILSVIMLVLFMPANVFGLGMDNLYLDNVKKMDVNIKNVFKCGAWGDLPREGGFYRVILADYYYVGTEVYIQPIESHLPGALRGEERIVKTITFPQFNNDHAEYYLENPVCREIENGMKLLLDADHYHESDKTDDGKRKVVIEIRGLGEPKIDIMKPRTECSYSAHQLQKEMNGWKEEQSRITFKSCTELEHAVELLSLKKDENGEWIFPEEERLRKHLRDSYGVNVSRNIIVMGYIDRRPSKGKPFVLVLGIDMNVGRSWATGFIAYIESQREKKLEKMAVPWALMDEWAPFGMIGLYTQKEVEGVWSEVDSAEPWDESDPLLKQALACPPCTGWLCDERPMLCFTDLNGNGLEEIHLKGRGPDFDDMVVLERTGEGMFREVLEISNGRGHWERWKKEWIFVGDMTCEGGEVCGREELGNPNCGRPLVYRFDEGGELKEDFGLRELFYPVKERPVPGGCIIDDPEGIEAYLPDGTLIRYTPSRND